MPESAEEFHRRASQGLRQPSMQDWDTFPFDGPLTPRPLAPAEVEPPRHGEGGRDCPACRGGDDGYLWTDENWRLTAADPGGLPVVVLLEPRLHYAEPGDLPDDVAADLGVMIARVERAVRSVPGIGRVHVCRWGDGAEHLHWWFQGRPAGFTQLLGTFGAIWDDVLPPTPDQVWRDNLALVVRALSA